MSWKKVQKKVNGSYRRELQTAGNIIHVLVSHSWTYVIQFTWHCVALLVPEVSLESEIFHVNETGFVYICVELKSYLKVDVTVHLYVIEYTATGV